MPKKLSDHFTLEEMIQSQTAAGRGIDNMLTPEVTQNLKALCLSLLEPVRTLAANQVSISSAYRSAELNKVVRGAKNSQHVLGQAADINCPTIGQKKLFDLIRKSGLPFDQVIDEFGSGGQVSYCEALQVNRGELVRACRTEDGIVIYPKVKSFVG